MKKIKIATRGSNLALKQVEIVSSKIKENFDIEIHKIKTQGDLILETSLDKIGGKALFVKQLEEYLLNKKAEIAIHSLKDMEVDFAKKTFIGAVLPRLSRKDVLISKYKDIFNLPKNAIIGTSSPRRKAFLSLFRKDLRFKLCRGNIETRINKLNQGFYDAIVLAEAGILRLNLDYSSIIPLEIIPPAAGQGVIAIQCLNSKNNQEINNFIQSICDEKTFYEITAERSLVKNLRGNCQSPISSTAYLTSRGNLCLNASISNKSGTSVLRETIKGKKKDASLLGKELAKNLILKGANEILDLKS